MRFLFYISSFWAVMVAVTLNSCNNAESLPNIIFILADDLGYSQTGCYGSSYYKTPNIDKLASEGMRFTNAYAACPVCSPTRASIMTGKYPARLHLTDFIPGNKNSEYPLLQPDWQKFLPLEELTTAELLKTKGYSTAIFGKWHLSCEKTPPESLPYNPDKQGFDEYFVTYKPVSANIAKPQPWQDAENDAHNVDTITSLSLNFIEKNRKKPFFLIVSHNTIHDPLKERAAVIKRYEEDKASEKTENNPVIAAMIERLDNSCGQIFDKVKESGLEENTIIIFFSDNGGRHIHAAQTPLRAGKGFLYEGGIREPLIVKWKNKVTPQTTCNSLISSVDFLPTFLEIAGIEKIPGNIDGVSFLPALKDPSVEVHQELFWHYPHYHSSGMAPAGAVRSGKWKLIEWYEKSLTGCEDVAFELFDLENDIGETVNLTDSLRSVKDDLYSMLNKWREEVNAQMPVLQK
jgi:uncharacterized sulfatase